MGIQIVAVLPDMEFFIYTIPMDTLTLALILSLGTIVVYFFVFRWWRHRRAAKLADKLLAEVVKGKDSFRR